MFELSESVREGRKCVSLSGELTIHDVERCSKSLKDIVAHASGGSTIIFDLSKLETIDTVGSGLFSLLKRNAEQRSVGIEIQGANAQVAKVLDRFLWLDTPQKKKFTLGDWLESNGDKIIAYKDRGIDFLQLVADTLFFNIFEDKRTKRVRKGAVWQEANQIGLGALGIVSLLTLLVGIVVALQAASLLKLFGADILMADMIGISMVRELAPLLTAIIMAGRSGASIAAEIATMMINEEIAGIRTMGLDPIKYVVLPKFRAISLTMPGLTVFSMVCGILGGFLIGVFYMGLSPSAFFHELSTAVFLKDVLVTLLKSLVFSWIIVWVAAHQGFSAYGGSDAVGRVTTSSVVLSIFWCIIADALFSIIFYF
ncbi:MAG: ABC transporter permease [Proteobacteria bacterium]|nr:ABC transporter permease [Pseudomonadota bacterium]